MKQEMLLSAGIDIGTTTTHLIISKIGIRVTEGFGIVPKAEIASKEIVYQSPIYFTPLRADDCIDGKAVAAIIKAEYKAAGVAPADLKSGAVIITGESAGKRNAAEVLREISRLAGDFISAEAGNELESYLSGMGAGADALSRQTSKRVANLDIGGGTTDISVFENGVCVDTCCLHIGGRLIRKEKDGIHVSEHLANLLAEHGISVRDLEKDAEQIDCLCDNLADYIFSALGFCKREIPKALVTDHLLSKAARAELFTFSGGVAACMDSPMDRFAFGDIGIPLAQAVQRKVKQYGCTTAVCGASPLRATVIGAGQFSLEVSGSTILLTDVTFPLKNLPCICALEQVRDTPCAICPSVERAPSFQTLSALADDILQAAKRLLQRQLPLVVIVEADCAKALGQCLKRKLPAHYPLLCADGIACRQGDYIDIGAPVADGRAVPVVVKTLVFGGHP